MKITAEQMESYRSYWHKHMTFEEYVAYLKKPKSETSWPEYKVEQKPLCDKVWNRREGR